MLTVFTRSGAVLKPTVVAANETLPSGVWYDLLTPTPEERHAVEQALGLELPDRADMEEIEASSRLYREEAALFMTATVLTQADTDDPKVSAMTFVLANEALVTMRYAESKSFQQFATRVQRPGSGCIDGDTVMLGILEALIDRAADVLERAGGEVDAISRDVFAQPHGKAPTTASFQHMLRRIGRKGDLASKTQESLVSIGRVTTFLFHHLRDRKETKEERERVKTMSRDIASLTDYTLFLSEKVNFLLDATLGMINIEQNTIIKIFSVVAVVFLPPTLVASIYGMNFAHMPEIGWDLGYPLALLLMVLSAILPLWYFRHRGWF